MMELNQRVRMGLLAQHGLFIVLLFAVVALLAFLAAEYRHEWDVTRSGRNTLSPATLEVLGQLTGPLTVTAYALRRDAAGTDLQKVGRGGGFARAQ
jgi:hypothetical protein